MKNDIQFRKNAQSALLSTLTGCVVLVGGMVVSLATARLYVSTHFFMWASLTLWVVMLGTFIISIGMPSRPLKKTLATNLPTTIFATLMILALGILLAYKTPFPTATAYLLIAVAVMWTFWFCMSCIMVLGGKVGDLIEQSYLRSRAPLRTEDPG